MIQFASPPNGWLSPRATTKAFLVALCVVSLHVVALGFVSAPEFVRRLTITFEVAIVIIVATTMAARIRACAVVAIGAGLNFVVIVLNGGSMPIDATHPRLADFGPSWTEGDLLSGSKDTPLQRDEINLFLLSDHLTISLPVVGSNVYSAGDVVLYFGVVLTAIEIAGRLALSLNSQSKKQPV